MESQHSALRTRGPSRSYAAERRVSPRSIADFIARLAFERARYWEPEARRHIGGGAPTTSWRLPRGRAGRSTLRSTAAFDRRRGVARPRGGASSEVRRLSLRWPRRGERRSTRAILPRPQQRALR